MILGFGGAAALIAGNGAADAAPTWALLIVVLASMSWALGILAAATTAAARQSLHGRRLRDADRRRRPHDPRHRPRRSTSLPRSYTAQAWTAWGFLVLVGSILALTAYNWLLQSTSVSLVATYAYVNPGVAVFLGWLILSEPVTGTTLLGAAVVVAGVALVVADRAPEPKDA